MGGRGSTRWNGHQKKTTVEECRVLSIRDFNRAGILEEGEFNKGVLEWTHKWTHERTAQLGFEVDMRTAPPVVRTYYDPMQEDDGRVYQQTIPLTSNPCNFGGKRWWFRCPGMSKRNGHDQRRCAKLYLPPGSVSFLCRECHDLTYRSCQQSSGSVSPRDLLL